MRMTKTIVAVTTAIGVAAFAIFPSQKLMAEGKMADSALFAAFAAKYPTASKLTGTALQTAMKLAGKSDNTTYSNDNTNYSAFGATPPAAKAREEDAKLPAISTPARDFGVELGDIANRLNDATKGTIAGIEEALASLENDANGSLNAAMLAAVKRGLDEKKAEFGSNGTHIPNAAAGDSSANARETGAPEGVKAEFDNDAGQERMQPGRDFGAELRNIADRLNAADSAAIAGIEKDLATLEKDDVNGSMNATILAVVKRGLADIKGQFNAVPAPKLPADSGTSSQLPENKGQQTQAENDTATASTAIVKVANTSAAVVNLNAAATAADANTAKGTILTREEIIDSAQYYVNELNAISQDGATSEQKCALWEQINAFAIGVNASLSTNEDAKLRSLLGILKGANEDLKNTIKE